jgi:toxin ParE1/3/4
MKMNIVYTVQAQQDLKNIYEYIAYSLLVPDTARSVYQKIIQGAHSLESMPERNPLYKEEPWRSQGVRFLPVKNYLLFYTVNSETHTVSVARILYGGMDISRQLEESINFS